MRREWVKLATELALTKADFYEGSKKIFRNRTARFDDPMGPIKLWDAGYTQSKLTMLNKLYVHEESLSLAVKLWERRSEKRKYGSVGFTCYNHLLKSHSGENANSKSSIMGPCLQAMTLTCTNLKMCEIDVFYRTTEIFKKFPADLVLIRDLMLSRFNFDAIPISGMTCHFANITVSPTFVAILLANSRDPIELLERMHENDERFHRACVVWTSPMTDPDHFTKCKFNQSRRVGKQLKEMVDDDTLQNLIHYFKQFDYDPRGEEPDEDE